MSLILKGIDMPKEKEGWQMDLRIHGFDDGTMMVEKLTRNGRPPFKIYSAIQIPTPHGRLIDGDELCNEFSNRCPGDCGCCGESRGIYDCGLIIKAPTILEAEE